MATHRGQLSLEIGSTPLSLTEKLCKLSLLRLLICYDASDVSQFRPGSSLWLVCPIKHSLHLLFSMQIRLWQWSACSHKSGLYEFPFYILWLRHVVKFLSFFLFFHSATTKPLCSPLVHTAVLLFNTWLKRTRCSVTETKDGALF